jgi:hypothetical protein
MIPNNNSDHQGTIEYLQDKIVRYFGSRNASIDPMYPLVSITCEVTDEDLNYIKDKVHDNIRFAVIIGKEGSDKVQGDFIYLG